MYVKTLVTIVPIVIIMKIANSSLSSNHPPELDSSTIKIKNLLQGY